MPKGAVVALDIAVVIVSAVRLSQAIGHRDFYKAAGPFSCLVLAAAALFIFALAK